MRWGVPALTLYFCMRYLSEGMHWTLPTMLLGFGGLLLLVQLGYVFAFGAFGMPEMGAGGPPKLKMVGALALPAPGPVGIEKL